MQTPAQIDLFMIILPIVCLLVVSMSDMFSLIEKRERFTSGSPSSSPTASGRTFFIPPTTLGILPHTLARTHRLRPGFTLSHFIRAHMAYGGSRAALFTPPARTLRNGPSARPAPAHRTPHPLGLPPGTAGSAPRASARRTRPGSLPSPRHTARV